MENYKFKYKTPAMFENIILLSNGTKLTGLYFENSKDANKFNDNCYIEKLLPIFQKTITWLDIYFQGKIPSFTIDYCLENNTPFQKEVINIITKIPYGQVITYNDIAIEIAKRKNIKKMSCQAIGHAVGSNPICIIVPCHRVVGINKNLVGYGGGIENKIELLKVEGIDVENYKMPKEKKVKRCSWVNLKNPLYVTYHDNCWGKLNLDEKYLFQMLILESFQAGLSWECVLNKQEAFIKAYDNFDIEKIIKYDENKINELLENKDIIRNKLKIKASISNSLIFKQIESEYGSFKNYLLKFSQNKIYYEIGKTTSPLSDAISKDLIKKGMKFVGSTIIYSYLQAIGIINSHEHNCYKFHKCK